MAELLVLVTLYVHEGRESEFSAYEEAALKSLQGYRGEVLHRMRCAPRAMGGEAPYEVHLLRFASAAAFEAYATSRAPFEEERDRVIEKSLVITGVSI